MIPNSTNLSQRQHCLPVSFNNFIFNSTISSQHQLHQLLNFNIVIDLKSTEKINSKKIYLPLDKHFLTSKFQLPKTCQDQRLKVGFNNKKFRVNKLGPSWPVSTEKVWRELNLSLGKMADGSDREVTQADQNNIYSQWSLFFKDLDELLSEYEQHRSTNDIAITENLTIRLENAVRA